MSAYNYGSWVGLAWPPLPGANRDEGADAGLNCLLIFSMITVGKLLAILRYS